MVSVKSKLAKPIFSWHATLNSITPTSGPEKASHPLVIRPEEEGVVTPGVSPFGDLIVRMGC